MASLYTTGIQRDAALTVFQRPYSDLDTNEKASLDNTWSIGTPGGAAGYAEAEIFRYGNYLYAEGLDTAPASWSRWFVYEIAAAMAPTWAPKIADNIVSLRDQFKQAALTTYSRIASNDATTSDDQLVKSWMGIRRSVMSNCLHQSRPVLAAPELIDGAMRWALYKVWNDAEWSWQILSNKTFEITAAGGNLQEVAVTPAIRSIRSMWLWVSSDNPAERKRMRLADADEMQEALARQLDAGWPEKFRLIRDDRTIKIQLDRTPDATYALCGEFVRRAPDIGAYEGMGTGLSDLDENLNTALALIPDEFLDVIERLTLGRVLSNRGRREGQAITQEAIEELESLARTDSMGEPQHYDARNRTRDVVMEQIYGNGDGSVHGGSL